MAYEHEIVQRIGTEQQETADLAGRRRFENAACVETARRGDSGLDAVRLQLILLYVLLGLETYSLLIGAFALFAVVSALMVLTQSVNWSAWSLAGSRAE